MTAVRSCQCAAAALVLVILSAVPSHAQFRGRIVVSGLTHPLAFVQDPSNPAVQFVVEQEGLIRPVQNGALVSTPFLDLRSVIATGGERGLIALAFARNYAESGRFFVSFVNSSNHLVVARFKRSQDPLAADPASRVDLQWSDGNRFITHPALVHYGGNLVFGADGFLYIGTGDGGESNDPNHRAQNPMQLVGKMLRIDVNVSDSDVEGFDIPAGNPFAGGSTGRPEVWSVGFRNPWRFSMDDPARGGTGGFVITDVGESRFEEIDYEPPAKPKRNYGWRNREAGHDWLTDLPPSSTPLVEPIYEYDRSWGRSVIGGFVYRGSALPSMRGRYVFGDFVSGRIGSLALSIDPTTGEATASDFRDHTNEINAGARTATLSSFGVDAHGELYALNWSAGTVIALDAAGPPIPLLNIDVPGNGGSIRQPFMLAGWALDANAVADSGISTIHVWAVSSSGRPFWVGVPDFVQRPDVGAFFGAQFNNSGYGMFVRGLPPDTYQILVYGFVTATQTFAVMSSVNVTVEPTGIVNIDVPANGATVTTPFVLGGWALDPAVVSGTGIATIHVWAFRTDGTGARLPQPSAHSTRMPASDSS
jgi:glucose/arabinose dehydrogenase